MSANATSRRVRRDVLDSPLRDFAPYRLAVTCATRGCRGERTLDMGMLAQQHGGRCLISNLILRLRCAGCGQPVDQVYLESGPGIRVRVRTKLLGLGD